MEQINESILSYWTVLTSNSLRSLLGLTFLCPVQQRAGNGEAGVMGTCMGTCEPGGGLGFY